MPIRSTALKIEISYLLISYRVCLQKISESAIKKDYLSYNDLTLCEERKDHFSYIVAVEYSMNFTRDKMLISILKS